MRFRPLHAPTHALRFGLVFAWLAVIGLALMAAPLQVILLAALLVAAATLIAVWPRFEAVPGEPVCRFCGRSQREVAQLIAAPDNTCICDGCIRVSSDVLDEGVDNQIDRVLPTLHTSLTKLLPAADAARLVAACTVLRSEPAWLLTAARHARSGGNFAAALEALEAAAEPRPDLALEAASIRLLDLDDPSAAAALDAIDAADLAPEPQVELRVLRAWASFCVDPTAPRLELATAARRAVEELGEDRTDWSAAYALSLSATLDARVALARGDTADAERIARAAVEQHGTAFQYELLADVLTARSDDAGAYEARALALTRCDAECPRGRRLARASSSPFR